MDNPFQHWIDFKMMIGVDWRCDLCSSMLCYVMLCTYYYANIFIILVNEITIPAPTLPPAQVFKNIDPRCTCVAARLWYILRYNDVGLINMDPAAHYDVCLPSLNVFF